MSPRYTDMQRRAIAQRIARESRPSFAEMLALWEQGERATAVIGAPMLAAHLEEGVSQSELARALRISRSAVASRLRVAAEKT